MRIPLVNMLRSLLAWAEAPVDSVHLTPQSFDPNYVGPEGKPCVHILDRGVALCGFDTHHVPAEWPPGHKWVGLHDPGMLQDVTCTICRVDLERDRRIAEEREEWIFRRG